MKAPFFIIILSTYFLCFSGAQAQSACRLIFTKAGEKKVSGVKSPFSETSPEQLHLVIQALSTKIDINFDKIKDDRSEIGQQVILATLGLYATPAQLVYYVRKKQNMKWSEFLRSAKLDKFNQIPKSPFAGIGKEDLLTLLQALTVKIDINTKKAHIDRSDLGKEIILSEVGIDASIAQLYAYVVETLKLDWNETLREAKLEGQIKQRKNPFTNVEKEKLIAAVQALDGKVDVNAAAMSKDYSEQSRQIIFTSIGINGSAARLFAYVTKNLKLNWTEFLSEARLAHRNQEKKNPFETLPADKIIEVYFALRTEFPTSATALRENSSERGKEIVMEVAGIDAPASYLHSYVVNVLGRKWSEWEQEAYNSTLGPLDFVPKKKIVATLKKLDRDGHRVNVGSIEDNFTSSGKDIVLETAGVKVSPAKLHKYLTKERNESWRRWLERAKLGHHHKYNPFAKMSLEQVSELLVFLDSEKVNVNAKNIRADDSLRTENLIRQHTGFIGTGGQLYYHTVFVLKVKWIQQLRSAKLEHRARRWTEPHLTDAEIVEAIKTLSSMYNPNRTAVAEDNSIASGRALEAAIGKYITPAQMIIQIRQKNEEDKNFWDYWLIKAELDPMEIRVTGSAPYFLLSEMAKGEIDSNYQALTHGSNAMAFEGKNQDGSNRQVAVDTFTPEDGLIRMDFYAALEKAMGDFSPREKIIFETMLIYYENRSYKDSEGMGDFIQSTVKPSPSEAEWKGLLMKMMSNTELRDLLVDNFSNR